MTTKNKKRKYFKIDSQLTSKVVVALHLKKAFSVEVTQQSPKLLSWVRFLQSL